MYCSVYPSEAPQGLSNGMLTSSPTTRQESDFFSCFMAAFTSPTLAVPMLESVLMVWATLDSYVLTVAVAFGILLWPAVVVFFKASPFFFLRSSTCFFNFWSSSSASFELRETMVFCVLLVAIAMSRMNLYGIENWFLASYRRFSMLANHRLRLRTAGSPQTWKLRARSLCSLYLDRDHPLGPSIVPRFHYIWVL